MLSFFATVWNMVKKPMTTFQGQKIRIYSDKSFLLYFKVLKMYFL